MGMQKFFRKGRFLLVFESFPDQKKKAMAPSPQGHNVPPPAHIWVGSIAKND